MADQPLTPPPAAPPVAPTAPPAPVLGPDYQPGGTLFDVDNASPKDYARHAEILRRRAEVAGLQAVLPQPIVAAPPAEPDPNDIHAVKGGEVRYFTAITWEQLGEQRGGWEQAVAKPTDA